MSSLEDLALAELRDNPTDSAVLFDFLGTVVRGWSANLEQVQNWCAVYSDFRGASRAADISVCVHEPNPTFRQRVATIEAPGRSRMWNGREPLLPPLREPGLDRYVYLQAVAIGRLGHAVLVVGGEEATRTSLALSCAVRGASFLGCELVPVDPEDLLALPWPKSLALDEEALAVLRISPTHPGLIPFRTRAGELRYRGAPSAVLPQRTCDVAADIAAVVILTPERRNGPVAISPVTEVEAFEWLLRHL